MRLFLAGWVGDGSFGNEYRPRVDAERWAVIDLRPDSTRPEGRVLVATSDVAESSGDVLSLGDDLDANTRTPSLRAIESRLGVTLAESTMRGIVAELLILHGDNRPAGRSRWRPLKANRFGRHRIVMLGETLYDAPVVQGVTITESFNQADSSSLGPDLTWSEIEGNFQTISNTLRLAATSQASTARADSDLSTDDHYSEMVYDSITSSLVITAVRMPSTSNVTFYGLRRTRAGGLSAANAQYRLEKAVSGSTTALTSFVTLSQSVPETCRTEVDGSTIEGFIAGVSRVSTTDTSITGNVRCGVRAFRDSGTSSSDFIGDNFEAGDLTAGPVSGGSTANIDLDTTGAGTKHASGGSTSSINVDATGAGSKTVTGGAEVNITIDASGDGTKHGFGGSEADIEVDATGGGSIAGSGTWQSAGLIVGRQSSDVTVSGRQG